MDGNQFDELSRRLSDASSRRGVLHTVAGATIAGALAAWLGVDEADTKRRKRKRKNKKKNNPPSCVPNCMGKTCGPDNCGGECGPGCAGGKVCDGGLCQCPTGQEECNGSCHAPCFAPAVRNPITCSCCLPFNAPCGPNCCSPLGCKNTICNAGESSAPCSFDAQCRPPRVCTAAGECQNS